MDKGFDFFINKEGVSVELNPFNIAPLSAQVVFESDRPVTVEIEVTGSVPVSYKLDQFNETHAVPIIGLYANSINQVTLKLVDEYENFGIKVFEIETTRLPVFFPDIEINIADESLMQPGMNLSEFNLNSGPDADSYPFLFDRNGDVRWFLNLSHFSKTSFPIEPMPGGNLLVGQGDNLYEYSMMGKKINAIGLANYTQHHEVHQMHNGNFLVAVSRNDLNTRNDFVIEINANGSLITEWDLREVLDVDRFELSANPGDWFHMNAIWYSEADDCIVVSGRTQGIVKLNRQNELLWILAPHKGWGQAGENGDGPETSDYLLTAIDQGGMSYDSLVQVGVESHPDFDWPWGQHACMLSANGNLMLFDNGFSRNFFPSNNSYSRMVEYQIDEIAKTVNQVGQYGRERGVETFSDIVSDVDVLPNGNRLMAPGNIEIGGQEFAKIIEVNELGNVVFEATITFKNLYADGTPNHSGFDIQYRAERLEWPR